MPRTQDEGRRRLTSFGKNQFPKRTYIYYIKMNAESINQHKQFELEIFQVAEPEVRRRDIFAIRSR